MRRTSAIASVMAVAAGCAMQTVDPCSNVSGTCVGLQVRSDTISHLDAIRLHAETDVPSDRTITGPGGLDLPIGIGVAIEQSAPHVSFMLSGVSGDTIVASAVAETDVQDGQHVTLEVTLSSTQSPYEDLASDVGDLAGIDLAGIDNADLMGGVSDLSPTDLATCVEGATRCNGAVVQKCTLGQWTDTTACNAFCSAGACQSPASCSGLAATCGPGGNENCCQAKPISGGSFYRSYDGVSTGYTSQTYQATVSPFLLDRFEVTVGRFREFEQAYPANKPAAGSGKNPNNPQDPGWDTSFPLPTDRTALDAMIACSGGTWTNAAGANESKPIDCVNWYVAQAFCIWDGGRLPTEAEWNFAASGGSDQRVYPWSVPATATTIDSSYAVYSTSGPANVGSKSTKGDSKYGVADLAGNVAEWVIDWFASPYPSTSCTDCANFTAASNRSERGGSYLNVAALVLSSYRGNDAPTVVDPTIGFRCARSQ